MNELNLSKDAMLEGAMSVCEAVTDKPLFEGEFDQLTAAELLTLLTVTQFVMDLCLNEVERRGELGFCQVHGPIVPYASDYGVETVLTRDPEAEGGNNVH